MRQRLAGFATAAILAGLLLPTSGAAAASRGDRDEGIRRQYAAGIQVVPKQVPGAKTRPGTANPYLALLPDPAKVDKSYWRRLARTRSAQRAATMDTRANATALAASPLVHDEAEPAGLFGSNDSHATAELVNGFGTAKGKNNRSRILGQFSPEDVSPTTLFPFDEDDGSIPLAGNPNITFIRNGATISTEIGNGPHGSAGTGSGDFDFVRLEVAAGQQLIADTDTPTGPLDTVLVLYDSAGDIVEVNDDDETADTFDSLLRHEFATAGTYYLMVSGFGVGTTLPADPFDSASGYGAGSEGPYDITIQVGFPDLDFYAMDLAAGDVVGATVKGAGGRLVIRDPSGREVFGSSQDATFVYAPTSPLPGGGSAVVDLVAARAGRYSLQVIGYTGSYDITLEVYRPGPEALPNNTVQTLFLDFDGQRVNTNIWDGPGVRDLSPLAGFLGRWGIPSDQESALIDVVIATVRENIRTDPLARGTNRRFDVRILNSRDNADPFGKANVHRVIVGGSVDQAGVDTIGVSQYIDPGNFATEDSALVLLDVLSDPAGSSDASLNTYLTPASDRVQFVGRALGNVISHELGHLYGNWHTDSENDVPELMDQGGVFPGIFGVGPDGVGGTADDADYDFGADTLVPNEEFTGTEDTLDTVAWALVKGAAKR